MCKMSAFGDLHTHTGHSRETDEFVESRLENYAQVKRKIPEFQIVGITDHDTMNYLEPMYRARKSFKSGELPLIIPGIEITSAFRHPNREEEYFVQTHVLGYFPQLIDEDAEAIRQVNSVMGPEMRKVLEGKLVKNVDIRLKHFFCNKIIPARCDFGKLKAKVLERYEQDKKYVERKEPKQGDIINWPLNSSDKLVTDVLLKKGIIGSEEEGKLYVDRGSNERINRLAEILAEKESIPLHVALEKAGRLQGSCHGDYNDPFDKISTQEAISLIARAGGIPVLAHPRISLKQFEDGKQAFFSYCAEELVAAGLKGMEAFYPEQDKLTQAIIDFCMDKGLYITGGSDDHQDCRNHIGELGSRCPIALITEMLKDALSSVIVDVNNEELILGKTEKGLYVPTTSLGQLSFEEAAISSIKNTGLDAKPLAHRRPQDIVVIVGEEERRTELELFRAYKDKGQVIAAYSVIIFSDKEAVNQSLNSNFELVTKVGLEKRPDIDPLNGQLVRDYLTTVYRQPTPTVDIIIEYIHKCETYVILIERGEYPFGDALPGGFAEPWKTYEETAIDEAEQETGLKVELVGTLGAYSDPDRDPYRKEKNTASVCYAAKVVEGSLRAGDDAKGVRLVKCSDLQRFLDEEDKQIPTYHYIAAGRGLEEGEPLERILFDHPQMLRDYFAGRILPMK